jgi:hypothetical protein
MATLTDKNIPLFRTQDLIVTLTRHTEACGFCHVQFLKFVSLPADNRRSTHVKVMFETATCIIMAPYLFRVVVRYRYLFDDAIDTLRQSDNLPTSSLRATECFVPPK